MIGKKVPNPRATASKAARVGNLCEYIEKGDREQGEKCAHYGARGMLTETPEGHRAEMLALATDAVRSKDPVNHYVLSWQEGEVPSAEQVEEAVDILLDEMGLEDHQAVYGLHADTDNYHLHVAVNRVNPETETPVKINNGFDKEALHKVVARIEHAQGWQRERRGRYQVNERGDVERAAREREPGQQQEEGQTKGARAQAIEEAAPILKAAESWQQLHEQLAERGMRYERKGSGAKVWVGETSVKASEVHRSASIGALVKRIGEYQPAPEGLQVAPRSVPIPVRKARQEEAPRQEPSQARRDVENRTGEKSAERQAIEEAAPILKAAESWQQLHKQLAERGMKYERKGSGAIIRVGEVPVKASAVARGASLRKLEKRLGDFQPAGIYRRVAERPEAVPLRPEAPRWRDYSKARQAHYRERNLAREEQRKQLEADRTQLRDKHRQQRAGLHARDWRGKGPALNALRSVLAADQAKERAAMRERHARDRRALQASYPPYPDYERWLREQQQPELAQAWRYRDAAPGVVRGDRHVEPAAQDIRAFTGRILGGHVEYRRRAGAARERAAFTDTGRRIEVHEHQDKDTVRAVLQLASQKWGGQVWVDGNARYLSLCVELAATEGFTIQNPELQKRIQQARAQQRESRQAQGLQQDKERGGQQPQGPKRDPGRGGRGRGGLGR